MTTHQSMSTHQDDLATQARYGDNGVNRRFRTFTETKAGYKTTEFLLTIVAIAAILIATYADDDSLGASDGWRYASWVAIAYIISRGLAKLGTREPYTDHVS